MAGVRTFLVQLPASTSKKLKLDQNTRPASNGAVKEEQVGLLERPSGAQVNGVELARQNRQRCLGKWACPLDVAELPAGQAPALRLGDTHQLGTHDPFGAGVFDAVTSRWSCGGSQAISTKHEATNRKFIEGRALLRAVDCET
jgi:hypothetical protein